LTFQKQSTACDKEAELDHSSHPYCTTCIYQLINWTQNKKLNKQNLSKRKMITLQ